MTTMDSPIRILDPELGLCRRCPGCDEYWPLDEEFWYRHVRRPDGYSPYCKACFKGRKERVMRSAIEISHEVPGLDMWVAEKIAAAGIDLAIFAGTLLDDDDGLYDVYRNVCKLAAWRAGDTDRYDEERAYQCYKAGTNAMREHLELLFGLEVDGIKMD